MARATFVKKARKNYKDDGIKKGDSYWHWKFRYGPIRRSKKQPRPSQLTQSEFLSTVYGIQEGIEDLTSDMDADGIKEAIENAAQELRDLADETESKISNMPDQLQDSETAEMLRSRSEACIQMADDLDAIDLDVDEELTKEEQEARRADIIDEAQGVSYDGE